MIQQIEVASEALSANIQNGVLHEIAPDLAYRRLAIVNVVLVGSCDAGDRGWVLVDAGIPGSAAAIRAAAAERFGDGIRPRAIVLTHGHFDHVGVLSELAEDWDVPIYAHAQERPYLDGTAAYPPADPAVGGGLVALLSPLYPTDPIDVSHRLIDLPADGCVPPLPGWVAILTPGHAAGHVSLWRAADKSLLAGDAFVTTAQESAYAVATQAPEIHGPPQYFTPDWQAAKLSVAALAALAPERAITGHGRAMAGPALREGLQCLAERFDEIAVPHDGRYVGAPARPEDGSAYENPGSARGSAAKSELQPTHPPLDVLKPVAPDIWVVDAAPIRAGGIPLPLRMTVIRLPDRGLLLHSPTACHRELLDEVQALGKVKHLVAPSSGHWMFVDGWQTACPEATTWAVAGLGRRKPVRDAGLRIDAELEADAPDAWGGVVDLVTVHAPGFAELELFHKPSRTLVLTDLVLNIEASKITLAPRIAAHLLGITAPHGEAPLYLRLILRLNRRRVAEAAARLIAFDPERVVFSHGLWFERDGREQLERSLRWLRRKRLPDARTISAGALGLGLIGLVVGLAVMTRRQSGKVNES